MKERERVHREIFKLQRLRPNNTGDVFGNHEIPLLHLPTTQPHLHKPPTAFLTSGGTETQETPPRGHTMHNEMQQQYQENQNQQQNGPCPRQQPRRRRRRRFLGRRGEEGDGVVV